MKSLKGTRTEKNLMASFAGESQARNRYTYFASKARKEGYEQIAAFFEETAMNEKTHAKIFFQFLEGGMVEITAKFPAGVIGTTEENLLASANGEKEEWEIIYKEAARVARSEGFEEVAKAFEGVSKVEKEHEARYRKLLENINKDQVFAKDKKVRWVCRECGHVHEGPEAPDSCPVCHHPKAFFEVKQDNY